MKKLLLDLRGNPGGVLEQAVDVSDVFLDKGLEGRLHPRPDDLVGAGLRRSGRRAALRPAARRARQPRLRVGLRDRGGSDPGPRPRAHRRTADVGQGTRPERLHAPLRRGARADDRPVLHAFRPLDPEGLQRPARLRKPGRPTRGRRNRRSPAARNGEVFYTDAGRVVYAAGGITPDVDRQERPGLEAPATAARARTSFFNFAVNWLARNPDVPRTSPSRRRSETSSSGSSSHRPAIRRPPSSHVCTTRIPTGSLVDLALKIEIVNAQLRPRGRARAVRAPATSRSRRASPCSTRPPGSRRCRRRSARWP